PAARRRAEHRRPLRPGEDEAASAEGEGGGVAARSTRTDGSWSLSIGGGGPMRVHGYRQTWEVADERSLEAALAWRDDHGGGIFWLSPDEERYPALAIRVSGKVADVIYFRQDGHPSFRCLGGQGLPEDGLTTLVYQGCDPAGG